MGVIPKQGGGVRIIHDCSRPLGSAVNDYAPDLEKQRFQTTDDAAKLVSHGCFLAKCDLRHAYRSVALSPESQAVTGFKWDFPGGTQYFVDRKLPFGSKRGPMVFHRLSQAVKRMMARRGFRIIAYLDDFLICEKSRGRCMLALNTLISLLRQLGFDINWSKVVDPTHQLIFLGIEFDSLAMALQLPEEKLVALREELAVFSDRKRASKKQIQSLAGKLSWAAQVIFGGRAFLRRIIDSICLLKHSSHKMCLSREFRQDVSWWLDFMSTFNGKSLLLDRRPLAAIYTDACVNGGGASWNNDWFYVNWHVDFPEVSDCHINEKETLAVVLAAVRWAPNFANKRVHVYCDNSATVGSINKGSSRNKVIMQAIRSLFWLSAVHNFHISARHIRGENNGVADAVSRLDQREKFVEVLRSRFAGRVRSQQLAQHMSNRTLCSLLSRHISRHARVAPGHDSG
jgi:hypothetical protein